MSHGEKELEKFGKALHISLPLGRGPFSIKLIALLTSLGGLSILASSLADIVSPQIVAFHFYLLRVATGIIMLLVGYGLIKRLEWSAWLYGVMSVIALYINPVLAVLPVAITMYLWYRSEYFTAGTPAEVIESLLA